MTPNGTGKAIIAVDDHPANLRLIEALLTPRGYRVRSFSRGRLALAAAELEKPDLMLLDISMPDMDGFEVCRRLRSSQVLSSVPVIFLSALADKKDKLSAFESGGLDYVTKPFDPELLIARIETHLRLRELQESVEQYNHRLEQLVAQQVREIATAQMATIFALAKLADSRDNETGRHIERVQGLCRILAAELSTLPDHSGTVTEDYVHNIYCASPLHDIGKVAIPDSILLKPGELTSEEFEVMKTHTTRGAATLSLVLQQHPANEFVRLGIEIAQSHHEWWDGSGYPQRLKALEIPLSARITAVADCYDALRSRRPYKEPLSHEEAVALIRRGRGDHFDPDIVDSFGGVDEACCQIFEQLS